MFRFYRAALLCVGAALSLMYLSTISRPAPVKPLATTVVQGCIPVTLYEKTLDRHHHKPEYIADAEARAFIDLFNAIEPVSDHDADRFRFDTYFHQVRLYVGIVAVFNGCVTFHGALTMRPFLRLLVEAKKKAQGQPI